MPWDDEEDLDTGEPAGEAVPEEPGTPREVKDLAQQLMRYGYIEGSLKQNVFANIIRWHQDLQQIFEPFDLVLDLDEYRGLAFLRMADDSADDGDEERKHHLVRKHRLTLEQSLLVAILRQFYLLQEQEQGVGTGTIKVPAEDLLAQLGVFLGDSGSDQANRRRLDSLLDNLKAQGIVYEPDKNDEVVIRPLIAHMANPESLGALLEQFRELSAAREAES